MDLNSNDFCSSDFLFASDSQVTSLVSLSPDVCLDDSVWRFIYQQLPKAEADIERIIGHKCTSLSQQAASS